MAENALVHTLVRKQRLLLVLFACGAAILYDLLFWGKENGLSLALFNLLFVVGLFVVAWRTKTKVNPWAVYLCLPLTLLSLVGFLYLNLFAAQGVVALSIVLLFLFTIVITLRRNGHLFYFKNIPVFFKFDETIDKTLKIYRDIFRPEQGEEKEVYKKIAWGILIALPLVALFTGLFSSADAVFSGWLENIFNFHAEPSIFWRLFRTSVMAWYLSNLLYFIFEEKYALAEPAESTHAPDATVATVVIILLDILFAIFTLIQIKYLFGGSEYVLKNGLTYAEYARQGFFQLVAVLVISGIVLLFSYYAYRRTATAKVLLGILQVILVGQLVVIGVSALRRMNLYQEVYGFTTLRLYVEWFLYWFFIGSGLFFLAVLVRSKFKYVLHGLLAYGLAGLVVVGLSSVDYQIAKKNVDRYLAGGQNFDAKYLGELSADAIRALRPLIENKLPELSIEDRLHLGKVYKKAEDQLAKRNSFVEYHWSKTWLPAELASQKSLPSFQLINDAEEKDRQFEITQMRLNIRSNRLSGMDCSSFENQYGINLRSFASVQNNFGSGQMFCQWVGKNPLSVIISDVSGEKEVWHYVVLEREAAVWKITAEKTTVYNREPNSLSELTRPTFALDADGSLVETDVKNREHFRYRLEKSGQAYSFKKESLN